ncbi:hypothetical protein [Vaginella massiliensis]|uniref:hypothetical protein n=1 Tax=Vaginella massiliensis TaxID=1816680 RepID=UPI0012B5AD78|nr:hypothetical protein [Vaginella massiliensis]
MKKGILLSSLVAMSLISSCASTNVKKDIINTETQMRGSWTVTNVSIQGTTGKVNAKVFDEAPYECYIGSQWNLVQNNNSGTYTLVGGGTCPSGTNAIKWTVSDDGASKYFNFKRVNNDKAKNVLTGYKMRLQSVTDSNMTLVQDVPFEGKIINIVYNLSR